MKVQPIQRIIKKPMQLLLPFPKKKPKQVQMTFHFPTRPPKPKQAGKKLDKLA